MIKEKKKVVVPIEDAPAWMIDNPFLKSGYRLHNSFKLALKSIFQLHNELLNIWTHLIGSVLFMSLLVYLIINRSYSLEIYKDVQQNFNNFHFPDTMKTKFKNSVLPIFDKIKKTSLEDLKLKLHFLNEPIENYKTKLNKFKNTLNTGRRHLVEELDVILNEVEHFQKNLVNKLHTLTDNSKHHLQEFSKNIDKWYEDHKKKLIKKFLPKFKEEHEWIPMVIYLLSVFACLGLSTTFHIFYSISHKVSKILQRLDMAGISILIFGSSFSSHYYLYKCMPLHHYIYSTFSFISCFGVFIASMFEKFHLAEFTYIKGLMFGVLGVGNGVALIHPFFLTFYANEENDYMEDRWFFVATLLMGGTYLFGLAFYIKKIPERFFPKTFDIWFNSHTIFHICVFIAAAIFYFALDYLHIITKNTQCSFVD